MKTVLLSALAVAVGVTGLAETAPTATAAETAPRSLDQLRESVRANALARLHAGEVETVRHRKGHRTRKYRSYRQWCGYKRYYGKRCYYTPWALKPLRQRR